MVDYCWQRVCVNSNKYQRLAFCTQSMNNIYIINGKIHLYFSNNLTDDWNLVLISTCIFLFTACMWQLVNLLHGHICRSLTLYLLFYALFYNVYCCYIFCYFCFCFFLTLLFVSLMPSSYYHKECILITGSMPCSKPCKYANPVQSVQSV